jgi:Domain of unknown function (DUF5076)
MSEAYNNDPKNDLIRACINEEGYADVQIAANQLEGASNFGRFLADVARHGALAYSTTWSIDEGTALEQIVDGLSRQLREQASKITKTQDGSLN